MDEYFTPILIKKKHDIQGIVLEQAWHISSYKVFLLKYHKN